MANTRRSNGTCLIDPEPSRSRGRWPSSLRGKPGASGSPNPEARPHPSLSPNSRGRSPLTHRPPRWWQATLPFVAQGPEVAPRTVASLRFGGLGCCWFPVSGRGMQRPVRKPLLLVLVALVSCGPASSSPTARSAGDAPADTSASTDSSGPRLPSCEDGSCFACGDTVCLKGYYCERLGNVSGCAWNAPCANKASCSCLTSQPSHDSSCSCEERDGNAFVSCP
jgi:hypothetical protein